MLNFITKVILSWVEGDFQKMELTPDRIVEQNEMSIITLKTYELRYGISCLQEFVSRLPSKEKN